MQLSLIADLMVAQVETTGQFARIMGLYATNSFVKDSMSDLDFSPAGPMPPGLDGKTDMNASATSAANAPAHLLGQADSPQGLPVSALMTPMQ